MVGVAVIEKKSLSKIERVNMKFTFQLNHIYFSKYKLKQKVFILFYKVHRAIHFELLNVRSNLNPLYLSS